MGKTDPHHPRKEDIQEGKNVPGKDLSATGDPFLEKVEAGLSEALEQSAAAAPELFERIEHGCLVGFSGGPDSTALLVALGALREKRGFNLFACHVNHHMRSSESDADEQFCRQLATKLGVPIFVRHLTSHTHNLSEADLRHSRFELLTHAAKEAGAGFIALGHTLDDQVETILFRFFRGTGLSGLVGMRPARTHEGQVFLLRPLLFVRRAECLGYLSRIGQGYRKDSSNDDVIYARNYLRRVVLPTIKDRFPGFEDRIEQLREIVLEDERLLDTLADQALAGLTSAFSPEGEWAIEQFRSLPASLKRRILAKELSFRGVEVTFERVRALLEISEQGGALSLNAIWDVRSDGEKLRWISKGSGDQSTLKGTAEFEVRIPGLTLAPALGKALRIEPCEEAFSASPLSFPDSNAPVALVDLTRAKLPLHIRLRRSGDHIRPFGMNELVRLKKFLHNKKPSSGEDVSAIPVIADQEEVLWVPGFGVSNKVKVTGQPTHRLTWLDIAPDEVDVC
jgi:tRNA(Ile)-lysidine synthase